MTLSRFAGEGTRLCRHSGWSILGRDFAATALGRNRRRQFDAEAVAQSHASAGRDDDRPALAPPFNPAQLETLAGEHGAERAGEVEAALAEVEARAAEAARARALLQGEVDAEAAEELDAVGRHL